MAHYLLKWNPDSWSEEKFREYFDAFERNEPSRWSCGNTKKIAPGDRFYLIKNGKQGNGLIGSGAILSTPYEAAHYDEQKAIDGKEALFVDVMFDYLVRPGGPIPILRSELESADLASPVWDTQGSGKTIPDPIATSLYSLWKTRVQVEEFQLPEEIAESDETFPEGATKRVAVNAYERSPEARRKCLNKWGYNCTVCHFHFELRYGPLGRGFMHVHHLRPLSSVKSSHDVNPVNDLRPVCPNCHAMLHRQSPPLSIEELQEVVGRYNVLR